MGDDTLDFITISEMPNGSFCVILKSWDHVEEDYTPRQVFKYPSRAGAEIAAHDLAAHHKLEIR